MSLAVKDRLKNLEIRVFELELKLRRIGKIIQDAQRESEDSVR